MFDGYEIMWGRGYRGHSGAEVPGLNLRCVPAVPWVCRGFNFQFK